MGLGYQDIHDSLLARIRDGELAPGSLLPSEVELAAEFGCARATVSRAMRALSDAGMIERRRKAGTRVCAAPQRFARFEMPLVRAEIEAMGVPYGYALVMREVCAVPGWLRARMGLEAGEVLHLRCVHSGGAAPFQVEDRWINPAAVPRVLAADFSGEGPNEWLVREVPFTDVEVAFSAEAATGWVAEALRLPMGDPVFCSERITWLQGVPVTLARMHFARGYTMSTRHHLG